uniref:Histone chaperone domain-containing protein n=1 Tax=Romanomermis culicivorax TaxID=13658 RepID=A0A915JG88_ROMCU
MSDSESEQEILASISKRKNSYDCERVEETSEKVNIKSKEFLSSTDDSSDSDNGIKSSDKDIQQKFSPIKAQNSTHSKPCEGENFASEDEEPSCSTDAEDKDDKNVDKDLKSEKRPRIDSSSSSESDPSRKNNDESNARNPKKIKKAKLKTKRNEDSESDEKLIIFKEKEDEKENVSKNGSKSEDDSETKKEKPNKETKNGKSNKKSISTVENQLSKLKKFIRAAGLRIQNYAAFFENCKNDKQRVEKLRNFFVEKGLTGKLSMKACQKFKLERETEREIAELDKNNILSNGRPKRRNVSSLFDVREAHSGKVNDDDSADEIDEDYLSTKKELSRLKGIIDSENDDD